jgi:hypothetical protein
MSFYYTNPKHDIVKQNLCVFLVSAVKTHELLKYFQAFNDVKAGKNKYSENEKNNTMQLDGEKRDHLKCGIVQYIMFIDNKGKGL